MKRFGYFLDPLCLAGCASYAANRWWIKPHVHLAFFHNWFNDCLLIPCALPPLLFAHDLFGIRPRGSFPTALEILAHWAGWSLLFEGIGPHIMRTTGDPWDVVAYAGGGLAAFGWWYWRQRKQREPAVADFDVLAPHYRWMEWLLAGRKLQRCRTAFLSSIPAPQNVLLLGEGNGRFLAELLAAHPGVRCTLVDASAKMLECARARLSRRGLDLGRVQFVHADALDWKPPRGEFDLVVTCFFLDCFTAEQLARLIPHIATATSPKARWLVADFRQPESGWAGWRAAVILRSMYLFFQRVTRLPAAQITTVDPILTRNGFTLRERRVYDWGMLHSDVWQSGIGPETVSVQA